MIYRLENVGNLKNGTIVDSLQGAIFLFLNYFISQRVNHIFKSNKLRQANKFSIY